MVVDVPGRGSLSLTHVVLDFNGTLAKDGRVSSLVEERLREVSARYETLIATSDTFGTATAFADRLGIPYHIVQTGRDKESLVKKLVGGVVAIGNGANDKLMLQAADLGILVLGPEGSSAGSLSASDIVVASIEYALDLLLYPSRLVATLRE